MDIPVMDITNMDRGTLTLLGTGCCVMLSLHFTLQLLSQHLFYWKNPKEQKAILIIILMAPLYAVVSFVGFVDIQGSKAFFTFLESVKECYEALVIAKFLALMYSYLNISISKNIVPDGIKGREIHHSFPMTLFQTMLVIIICDTDISLDGDSDKFIFIDMENTCSNKFTVGSKKWVFGFTAVIWGIVLEVLVGVGVIKSRHFWLDVEHIEQAIQNVLVCVEMVIFSVIQQYAYHVAPYSGDIAAKLKMGKAE
ncbi:hypothetical protein ACLOJK_041870 [Asimina triloba]